MKNTTAPRANTLPSRRREALGMAFTSLALAACGGGSSSESASSDATLAGLSLSTAGLSPTFDSATTAYTLAVANSVSSLTVTPTATDSGATIQVNGSTVASGSASAAISLAVGATTLSIVVTAANGSTSRTYTVVVTRAAASASSDASLSALALSAGTLSPSFAAGTTAYAASVANGVESITVTPTATDDAATITVSGNSVASGSGTTLALSVGSNAIPIVVTAEDGVTTRSYTVTVTRAATSVSSDATLSALTLSAGTLSPTFSAATLGYTATVANSVSSMTVTPTSTSSAAGITVNGSAVDSGSASSSISLAEGTNTVSIVVTAEDGTTTRTYTLTVTRNAAGSCTITATETQGPYPLLAILSNSSIVRSDIRESKTGVPLTLNLTILDSSSGCAAVSGAAVYIWHCDKDGLYSGYDTTNNAGQSGLTYLRGIQVTDSNGTVSFTTIYPGWYAGRITHIHAQVYLNDDLEVTATATTQLAFPLSVTTAVYNSSLYTKGQNTSVTSFSADNVFSDGTSTEMVTISGDVTNGYTASLTITIA